jgi:D-alanyl-D-alanine carboxypeptidase
MPDAQDRGWGPPCPEESTTIIHAGGVADGFRVHKRVARIFTAFINELVERGYKLEGPVRDDWAYCCRHIDNDPKKGWSNHAWGLAVDLNALKNPQQSPLKTNMPPWVRQAQPLMDKYGLRWGGTFSDEPDPMHFEFMLSPADADRISAQLGGLTMAEAQDILNRLQSIYEALRDGSDTNMNSLKNIRGHVVAIEADVKALKADVQTLKDAHPHG